MLLDAEAKVALAAQNGARVAFATRAVARLDNLEHAAAGGRQPQALDRLADDFDNVARERLDELIVLTRVQYGHESSCCCCCCFSLIKCPFKHNIYNIQNICDCTDL